MIDRLSVKPALLSGCSICEPEGRSLVCGTKGLGCELWLEFEGEICENENENGFGPLANPGVTGVAERYDG